MKIFSKIFIGIFIIGLLITLLTKAVIKPWLGKKVQSELAKLSSDYRIEAKNIDVSLFSSSLELNNVTIQPRLQQVSGSSLEGRIVYLKIDGINVTKLLFRSDIAIKKLIISNGSFSGNIPFSGKNSKPLVSPANIQIGKIFFDKIDLDLANSLNAQAFSVKEGNLKVSEIQVNKSDTLSPSIIGQFDFDAAQFSMVSDDSLYFYFAKNIQYSASSSTLMADSFSIHPNYKNYEFTSQNEFQTDRIEAGLSNIIVNDFSAADYLKSKNVVSSSIEIGNMDLNVFRDKRKKFNHLIKPTFQEMIYNYPGLLNIDSISILAGNIAYTEHAEKASEPGIISFTEIAAKLSKISNDTLYKSDTAFLELQVKARLMGKGNLAINLKSRLFDVKNTFTVDGTLSGMDASDLNPMLEKNAFVYVTSGKINAMDFSFSADNTKATGKTTVLYQDLFLAVKNKHTNDTTAFVERLISIVANIKVMDSNPIPGKEVRVGVIDYQRDPERFLFNYCFKSIMTGIKSSLAKDTTKRKK